PRRTGGKARLDIRLPSSQITLISLACIRVPKHHHGHGAMTSSSVIIAPTTASATARARTSSPTFRRRLIPVLSSRLNGGLSGVFLTERAVFHSPNMPPPPF
ncbi:MAG: hypothetical protein KTR21_07175, partial [Rhodobacteraceae bacterium]|nr:hypothetical protein [Paracoccaceae bacterium]